jgi:RNA polymerase sigma-70 factor (ECF subfamily)
MVDDEILVERIKNGDLSAFDELMKKYYRQISILAYKMTGSYEDAEDIAQEVFARVFKSLPTWKPKASFYTWLRTVTMNLCIDYHRTKVRHQTQSIDNNESPIANLPTDPSYSPLENVEANELRQRVLKAAEELSPQQRKAFMLCHYGGLSREEASQIMNCAVGTIKAHLSRATAKMRDLLKDLNDN